LYKNGKYILAESVFTILIITENCDILQLNQDFFVSRIVYRVSREEKELEKKEDRKTKAINILLSFLLST